MCLGHMKPNKTHPKSCNPSELQCLAAKPENPERSHGANFHPTTSNRCHSSLSRVTGEHDGSELPEQCNVSQTQIRTTKT